MHKQVVTAKDGRRLSIVIAIKGMLLYIEVSRPSAHSKRFTLHPPADLFTPTPTRPLWEAFSYAKYCAKTSITFPPLSIAR